jgi:Cysteine-rich secretory protein family
MLWCELSLLFLAGHVVAKGACLKKNKPTPKPTPTPAKLATTPSPADAAAPVLSMASISELPLSQAIQVLSSVVDKVPLSKSGNFQQDCLKIHNDFRAIVGMQPFAIDNNLINAAQKWANQLAYYDMFQHSQYSLFNKAAQREKTFTPAHRLEPPMERVPELSKLGLMNLSSTTANRSAKIQACSKSTVMYKKNNFSLLNALGLILEKWAAHRSSTHRVVGTRL